MKEQTPRREVLTVKGAAVASVMLALIATFAMALKASSSNSPLAGKTRAQLLDCFSSTHMCGVESMWDIANVLGKRKNEAFLLSQFRARETMEQRLGIIYSLYRINDPKVAAFYKHLIAERFDDGEYLYYPLNYLAKRCDKHALWILSGKGKGGYPGRRNCLQWATTVELFGKCEYRPAVPMLIGSLNYACMNVGAAADDSLRKLFPGSPEFDTIKATKQYFRQRSAVESKSKQ